MSLEKKIDSGKTEIGIKFRENQLAQGRKLKPSMSFRRSRVVTLEPGKQGKATKHYETKARKRFGRLRRKWAVRASR